MDRSASPLRMGALRATQRAAYSGDSERAASGERASHDARVASQRFQGGELVTITKHETYTEPTH